MRLFYRPVYGEFVDTTTERFTSPELGQMMGAAEKLVVQIRAFKIGGTSPTLTVRAYRSDDNVDFNTGSSTVLLNAVALTAGTVYFNMLVAQSSNVGEFGGFERLSVQLGGTSPSAQVELVVCGRGESLSTFRTAAEVVSSKQ